jgi:ferredoxin--NADP+ reductase
LAVDPIELESTDIADHALFKLKQSNIRSVIVCGRRGPEHATFSAHELRNLLRLKSTNVCIDSKQIEDSIKRIDVSSESEKDLKSNIEVMKAIVDNEKKEAERKISIKFLSSPVQIKGNGEVTEILFRANRIEKGRIVTTDETFSINTGLVITAIGYDSIRYPGVTVERGQISNIAGHVEHNVYVVGWAKRGPTGAIGTNKSDSKDVVDLIIKNLREPKASEGIAKLLKPGHEVIDQVAWEKINASEVISGEIVGKPRVKVIDIKQLIGLGKSR